ncbi:hypothetical protein SISSUDRAFT_576698 [Sistotremastrum suecicum HHB10207 ss-3]|uniref:Uncharacterized protein n=1 Tax=Sistotremastrum suecicum HHB10207 ss-3 TaxID=1314776 RepID=A0A165XF83_9AGAM|nr:hypothetical protein SISSUDRAFT_576698 [Sistotremastrum suecicum HHB10207 ss-3]
MSMQAFCKSEISWRSVRLINPSLEQLQSQSFNDVIHQNMRDARIGVQVSQPLQLLLVLERLRVVLGSAPSYKGLLGYPLSYSTRSILCHFPNRYKCRLRGVGCHISSSPKGSQNKTLHHMNVCATRITLVQVRRSILVTKSAERMDKITEHVCVTRCFGPFG